MGHLPTLRAEKKPKVGRFTLKTMPKHILNNSKTTLIRKTSFLTPKMTKNDPSKPPKRVIFWNFRFSRFIYQPFELKIPWKVGLLRSKMMLKHFLNNSKTTSTKSRKRLCRPPKMAKTRMSTWPKVSNFGSIFALKALFLPCWHQKISQNRSL